MTRNYDLIKLAPIHPDDTARWHLLDPEKTLTTACGHAVSSDELRDRSPEGDTPDGLTGNTVCYECSGIGGGQ